MGKRIRHLEFYGYADQNAYIGLPNADLSDIREVNKEQDKEINAISGATKDKADLSTVNELSGKVDTFIDKQDLINKWLAKGINKNRERIDGLERRDEEITNKINEIVDDFNPIYDELGRISRKTDELDAKLTEHIAESEEFENRINNKVDGLEDGLEGKLDKTEAYDTFAKKADVYTKREVDELIEDKTQDYATEQWVMSRGFIKETDADGKYASKARLNALEDRVGDIQTTLYNQYNELNSDLSQYKTVTNGRIETLYNRVGTLETKCDREIANLQEDIAELTEDVTKNTNDIYQINNVALPSKADKADLNTLESRVNNLSDSLNNKVDKTDYERDKARFGVQLDSLDNRKADRTELRAVSGAVDDLASDLEEEKRDRIAGDNALGQRIDAANVRIDDMREENLERDQRLNNLERDLTKEINDRVEGDNAIIGSASDREEDYTIYGAKKYADKVANNALNDAKYYTDVKDGSVRDYIDETKANLERQITAKADKAYVNAIKGEIEASVDDKIATEKQRAETVELGIANELRQETIRAVNKENIISNNLAHTSNIVKALTDWDGDDREDYTDVGNGIVDVMHRELHRVNIDTATTLFADAVYYKLDNKIHFRNANGDEVCTLDVSDFSPSVIDSTWTDNGVLYIKFTNGDIVEIDLRTLIDDDVFKDGLQVIDGVVSVKKDPTSETYLSISANGVKISGIVAKFTIVENKIEEEKNRAISAETVLSERIDEISSGSSELLNQLIEKLGYTDNDTIERNNGGSEVAFGSYNISTESNDPAQKTLFSIGNGTDDANRSNALEVKQNGDLYLWIEGEFMNVNKILAQIAHEVYDIDSTHNSHFLDGE
jgi:archaellum component FlaC